MFMNRIKELRKLYDITQAQLADACGHEYVQTVQRYETGARKLTVDMMEEIAQGFTKLGYPTKPSELLPLEHQLMAEQAELISEINELRSQLNQHEEELLKKLRNLNPQLRKQHDEFLTYLATKAESED